MPASELTAPVAMTIARMPWFNESATYKVVPSVDTSAPVGLWKLAAVPEASMKAGAPEPATVITSVE